MISPIGPHKRGPEGGRDDQRHRRQPGAGAVQPGLDDVVADQFEHDDQPERPQHQAPARIDREGQRQRKHRRDHRPDVGHEAHHRGQRAPQHRARHADQPQPQRHRHAVAGVDDQLHDQVLADARAGLVHRVGGAVQVAAEQPQHAVAQVLPVEQHQEQEHQHDAGIGQRPADRAEPLAGLARAVTAASRRPAPRCGRRPAAAAARPRCAAVAARVTAAGAGRGSSSTSFLTVSIVFTAPSNMPGSASRSRNSRTFDWMLDW